jgi:hypothetical protein
MGNLERAYIRDKLESALEEIRRVIWTLEDRKMLQGLLSIKTKIGHVLSILDHRDQVDEQACMQGVEEEEDSEGS